MLRKHYIKALDRQPLLEIRLRAEIVIMFWANVSSKDRRTSAIFSAKYAFSFCGLLVCNRGRHWECFIYRRSAIMKLAVVVLLAFFVIQAVAAEG